MKKKLILVLGLVAFVGSIVGMQGELKEKATVAHVKIDLKDAEVSITQDEFEEFKAIMPGDVKSILEESPPYSLPSVDKSAFEFLIANLEYIKNEDLEKLMNVFKNIYDLDQSAEFAKILNASAYLCVDTVLLAAKNFIDGEAVTMIYDKKFSFLKAILEMQILHKQVPFFDIDEGDDITGNFPLYLAAACGYKDIVELLIAAGANVNKQDKTFSRTALITAADTGYTDIVMMLIKAGADLDKQDRFGKTAFSWATKKSYNDTAKALIEAKVKKLIKQGDSEKLKNLFNEVFTLNFSLQKQNESKQHDPFLHLLKNRAYLTDDVFVAALASFIEENVIDMVRYQYGFFKEILKAQLQYQEVPFFDVNIQPEPGHTPVTQVLILRNSTPLMLAILACSKDMVSMLIDAGAKLNKKDNKGDTALMYAAKYRQKDIVKMLINAGAKLNKKNNEGDTALALAQMRGYKDIVKLLNQANVESSNPE